MASKNPMDVSELMKMFSPEKISSLFDPKQMNAMLDPKQFKGFDLQSMMNTQRAHYDAMLAANTEVAAAYRPLYETQMKVYQDLMGAASRQAKALQAKSVPDLQEKQKVIYEEAVQKSLSIMTELAAATQKANEEASQIIKKKVETAIKELGKNT